MSTPASIARHPIHPILVAFPIGLWVFSVVADLIYQLGWGRATWSDVAFYSIGGGIVGALLAAVPGFIDFLSITDKRVRAIGIYHMAANLLAVVIFGVSFWLRWMGGPARGRWRCPSSGWSYSDSPAGSAASSCSCTAWA
jgi:uncharacterized membrane protein